MSPTFRLTAPHLSLSQQIALSANWALVPAIGLRYYDHSHFASKVAPHAGLSLVSDNLTLFANYSRGINYPGLEAPVLSSLMAFAPTFGASWPKLQPESDDHAEVGLKLAAGEATTIDLSLFQDKVTNRYIFGFPPAVAPPPQFMNLGDYTMKGGELAIRQGFGPEWSLFAGLTLLNPSISNLPYTPKTAVTAGVNGVAGPIRVALDGQYQSPIWALNRSRNPAMPNNDRIGGFAVVNTRLANPLPALGKQGEVFVTVENLLNRKYGYRLGYEMPGIQGQLGVAGSF